MEKIETDPLPERNDYVRFLKIMNVIYGYLTEDSELISIHNRLKEDTKYYQGDTWLLAQDFYWSCIRYDISKY